MSSGDHADLRSKLHDIAAKTFSSGEFTVAERETFIRMVLSLPEFARLDAETRAAMVKKFLNGSGDIALR